MSSRYHDRRMRRESASRRLGATYTSQRSNCERIKDCYRVRLYSALEAVPASLQLSALNAPGTPPNSLGNLPLIPGDGNIALICQQTVSGSYAMKGLCVVGLLSLFAASPALAQEGAACAAKAVSKDGKALTGAAKASSMKKCCETSAVGKDGKKLAGAAKTSFMKKCEAGT